MATEAITHVTDDNGDTVRFNTGDDGDLWVYINDSIGVQVTSDKQLDLIAELLSYYEEGRERGGEYEEGTCS
jgi:hypothetical protein